MLLLLLLLLLVLFGNHVRPERAQGATSCFHWSFSRIPTSKRSIRPFTTFVLFPTNQFARAGWISTLHSAHSLIQRLGVLVLHCTALHVYACVLCVCVCMYRDFHQGHRNVVAIQDLVFAAHALVLSSVTASQIFMCGYERGGQRVHWWCIGFLIVVGVLAVIYGGLCIVRDKQVRVRA